MKIEANILVVYVHRAPLLNDVLVTTIISTPPLVDIIEYTLICSECQKKDDILERSRCTHNKIIRLQ